MVLILQSSTRCLFLQSMIGRGFLEVDPKATRVHTLSAVALGQRPAKYVPTLDLTVLYFLLTIKEDRMGLPWNLM